MNIRRNRIYWLALMIGLGVGAYANPKVPEPMPAGTSYTNCQTYYKCNVEQKKVGTIDPCCCSINSSGCYDYEIDEWQCAAGGTLYDNFRQSGGPYPTSTCGTYTDGSLRCF